MEIKEIEEYPRKMAIEGEPSDLYTLLNSAINGLAKSINILGKEDSQSKELIERRKKYIKLFDELNNQIKFHD